MSKILINENKALKLTNVLIYQIDLNKPAALQEINTQIIKMQNYIKVKGCVQLGPLIQYNDYKRHEKNKVQLEMYVMLQASSYIDETESPYIMEQVIYIPNCMYCRYTGPEDKLKFAYDKIRLMAFEQDIPLKDSNYTIYVDRNDDAIIADVFMERADNE